MGKTRRKSKKSKKSKTNGSLCEICGKSFSKNSNRSNHVKKVHQGLRWCCNICGKFQVSKHSHERHYETKHNGEMPENITCNQRYVAHLIEMPAEAKNAIIAGLNEKVQVQRVLIQSFRNRLLDTLKSNIELKSQMQIDCEKEKLEYNKLLADGEERDSDVEFENDESDPENVEQDSVEPNEEGGEIGGGNETGCDDGDGDSDDEDDDEVDDNIVDDPIPSTSEASGSGV